MSDEVRDTSENFRETKSTSVPYWVHELKLESKTRALFRDYVGLKDEDVDNHIKSFRDVAWQVRPYPCVGMWTFLKSTVTGASIDNEEAHVLARLNNGGTFLDVGCAMAQDSRWLAARGAPTENMVNSDITPDFFNSSFDLFLDRATLRASFVETDLLAPDSALLVRYRGHFDVIVAGDLFHLFDKDEQLIFARHMLALARPAAGTVVMGKHYGREGTPKGTRVQTAWGKNQICWMAGEESFRELWMQAVEEVEGTWEVKVREVPLGQGAWTPLEDYDWVNGKGVEKGLCGLQFVVKRIA